MRENSPSSRWVKTSPPPWARVHSLPAFLASAWVSWVETTLPFSSFTFQRSSVGMTWMFGLRGAFPGAGGAKTLGSAGGDAGCLDRPPVRQEHYQQIFRH